MSRPSAQLLVERALAVIPLGDEFLPLSDALIGASHTDREKLWARTGAYATVGKRVLDAERLSGLVPAIVTRAQERMERLFAQVIEAVRLQGAGDAAGAARALRNYEATQLGSIAIRAALDRAGIENDEVEYVIMGQVLQGGAGQAPARQAAIGAGLPKEVPADTINKVCASSVRAVEIADALIRAGEVEEAERRLEQAQQIYTLALEMSRDLREKGPQILALRRLGRSARAAGRLEEGWEWYQRSFELSVAEMDEAGQAIACQGLGNLCDDRGQRPEARAWYERGLEIARRLDDPDVEWPFYTNLSVLAMQEGQLPLAESLLERARERIVAAGAESSLLFWLNNRGLLLMEAKDPAAAEAVFREALARSPDARWEVVLRVNLGGSLVRQERLLEAQDEARRAEEIAILNRLVPDLVNVYMLLGSLARAQRDEEGFVFYEQALRVYRERGMPRNTEAAILHDYGLLHARCGRPADAYAYLDAAGEIYAALGLAPELARIAADRAAVADGSDG